MSRPKTTAQFIEEAKAIHGEKYSYNKTQYVTNKGRIIITCPVHGDFEQRASAHISALAGCRQCMFDKNTLTTDEFIAKAKAVHGDKYNYSKAVYINNDTKVEIICSVHGSFMQTPNSHVSAKQNCPKCRVDNRNLTTEKFISKAKEVHGDKYDYSNTVYVKQAVKVEIGCKSCGQTFSQLPNNHLAPNGCPNCAPGKPKHTIEKFIEKAKAVHSDKYDYSESVYTGIDDPITIRCLVHDKLTTHRAADHLRGNGCRECGLITSGKSRRSNTDEFIAKAREIHGDRYDYSLVDYVTSTALIIIGCKQHGLFSQQPSVHLMPSGCPRCSESKGETALANIFDEANITYKREYRIGDNKYRYDFYLPEYRLLIEYHGGQHYFPIDYFGGEEAYKRTVERDKAKITLAKFANINMISFKYTALRIPKEEFKNLVLAVLEAVKNRKSISWFFKEYAT